MVINIIYFTVAKSYILKSSMSTNYIKINTITKIGIGKCIDVIRPLTDISLDKDCDFLFKGETFHYEIQGSSKHRKELQKIIGQVIRESFNILGHLENIEATLSSASSEAVSPQGKTNRVPQPQTPTQQSAQNSTQQSATQKFIKGGFDKKESSAISRASSKAESQPSQKAATSSPRSPTVAPSQTQYLCSNDSKAIASSSILELKHVLSEGQKTMKAHVFDTAPNDVGLTPKVDANTKCITQLDSKKVKQWDMDALKHQLAEKQKEINKLKEKHEQDTRQILLAEVMRSVAKEPKTMEGRLKKLAERNADLIERLAAEMNARIAENEENFENIAVANRPMRVADEYSTMMANAWLDAKVELDEINPDEQYEQRKQLMMCRVLQKAEGLAKKRRDELMQQINIVLKDPFQTKEDSTVSTQNKGAKSKITKSVSEKPAAAGVMERPATPNLPSSVSSSLDDYLRQTADYTNIEPLIKDVKHAIIEGFAEDEKRTKDALERPALTRYIDQCSRLAWKMASQKPAMRFQVIENGTDFKRGGFFELAYNSKPDNDNAVVKYTVCPALLHGDKCMVKGIVFVE